MTDGHQRPWWLRLDGQPLSYERVRRARWPDRDELTPAEQFRRERDWGRSRQRDWLARHSLLVLVVGPILLIGNLAVLVGTLLDAGPIPPRSPCG